MTWADVERSFNRAVYLSFSRKKMALTLPVLILCGILIVFCRAVAYEASDWIAMSFLFLPIFLSSGVLLALGVLLIRIYYHEAKHLSLNFRRLIAGSLDLIIGTSYLAIPPILAYLCFWILLGIFFLLKEIPWIGDFFSIIFSFAPFLLLFGSLLLVLLNLGLLFFVAPAAALQSVRRMSLAKRVFDILKTRLFSALVLLLISIIPVTVLVLLLTQAALLTNISFSIAKHSLTVALEWFVIMLPFAAILTPAVVFFFNFAAESYQLLQSHLK